MKTKLNALSAWLDRHALPFGAALAAALSLLLALYNVGVGPLGNLNDIGGWRNRALYIALTAAVQLFVLLAAALLYHERFWRLAVRQLLLTVGLVILLMGVNHKSYLFVEQMLPFIRRMDAAGLSAMNDMRLNLSAPAVTALYLLTRGPIYDMYMLKLACMGAFLLMAVLAAHAADRRGWGLRGEALLLLCLILPQGFLTAGSAPQIDALSALLLVAALTLLEGQAAALPGELSALTEKRSAAEETAQTALQAKKALEQHPLYPAAEPELRQRAEAIQPDRTPSLLLVLFPASLIVVAAALAFLFRAQQPLPFWLFIGMAGLGMIATLFAARSRRQAIVERHKYAETQRAALETQIAEYLPLRQQADEAARRAEVSAADSEDACRRRLRDLLTQGRVFAPAAADLSGIQLALSDARRRKTALADARQTAREAALYRDALRVQLPEQPAAESSIQRPALSREEAAAELARTQALLAQERTRFDTLTGRIRALDRSSDLEAQLAQKQEQLTALQDEYDAIALAMDTLSQANTVLQNRFSPALGARAAEIFSAITGGRYDHVLLSRDFSLSAEPAGDPVGRSVRLLSQGAADQLYLAVRLEAIDGDLTDERLAICDMVLPADKRVPLILDDALVTFDDERLHAALDYLLEESQRRQILLFTCQKREMAYLQGKENVTVTKL